MATEVLVPLAGNIWVVLVNVGDEVEEDDDGWTSLYQGGVGPYTAKVIDSDPNP